MKMKTKATVHRMVTVLLAIAVSPLCLSAANYYTKASGRKDVYAVGSVWADIEGTVSPDAPSPGNNYYVVTGMTFQTDGVFGGDSLSLGLPSVPPDGTAPEWIKDPSIFPGKANGTYTINDLRLYSGTIYARSDNKVDFTIAGTATVYSVSRDAVVLKAYRNQNADSNGVRRSMNLASTLKGESDAVLTLNVTPGTPGPVEWDWPAVQAYLVLSGDFSEYHGRFYMKGQGGLILLNTPTAFGCEADGAKADVYYVTDDAIMAVAADKSTSMSRTRGVTIYRYRTLTLTTTNIVDEALPYRGNYSGYTVTFPISGEGKKEDTTTLVKSGEGTVTLDCACNVGTVRVDVATLALGPNFVSSTCTPNLVLAAGTQIALADGVFAEFPSVTVEGAAIDYGIYTGTGGPAYATPVSWISGTGTLLVRPSTTPAATVADTWNAAGDAGLMSASTSWVSGSAPDLTTGEFLPTFANVGSGAVVDAFSFLRGIVFNVQGNFALTGEKTLMLYDSGITATNAESASRYTVATPIFARASSQTWNVGENATVAIEGAFGGMRDATVTKTGSGSLDISGTNDYPGALSVKGGRLRLSGVFGSFAETDDTLSVANNVGAGMTLAGVTINKPVTQKMKNSSGDLIAEAGTTNVFNGRVEYSRGGSIAFPLGDGVVIAYNDGLTIDLGSSTTRNFMFSKDGTVATPPLVRFCGSPSVVSGYDVITFKSEVTCRFEVPGNAIMKYQSTGNDRLEATVDYAWNGTDGIGAFTISGKGSVIDVGSTRQCIRDVTINNSDSYYAFVAGNGGTLELAPTEDQTIALNQLRFEGMVSLQKHGTATLTLTNKTESAYSQCYGDVAVTNGVLEFAAGATWLNGTNVTVSGSGTLKLNAANTFNRTHAVIRFADSGVIEVPAGVTQVFADGWDGDRRLRGTYKTGSSSRVTGGGAIRIGPAGIILIVE